MSTPPAPVIAKAGKLGGAMNGTALFWIATAELIGEGTLGPYPAAWLTAVLSAAVWVISRQAAAARRGTPV
jgi:hypothetical protein